MNPAAMHTNTVAALSETNRSNILQHLYHHGVSSRAQIAQALALTPAAITKITARLIEAGVIEEAGDMEGRKNRRSIGLKLDTARFHVIGVKFARSLVQIGVFDLAGTPLSTETLPTVREDTIASTIADIHARVERLIAADRAIVAVGMAVPGPYLRRVGRIAVVSGMQGWRSVNFLEEFQHAFSVPVFIEHDARAGVLAHSLFDPDCPLEDDLAYYLIGEGVGLGVIEGGQLVNGAIGAATEIGHISIDVNGRPCDCGNYGCLERYCSASAIHAMLADDGTVVPDAGELTHAEACNRLFAAADGGNARAESMVREIGRYVGYGCVIIFNAFNPRRIIIGDIISGGGRILLDEVRSVVAERAIPEIVSSTAITLSGLTADATLAGSAAVAVTQFLDHPSIFFDVA